MIYSFFIGFRFIALVSITIMYSFCRFIVFVLVIVEVLWFFSLGIRTFSAVNGEVRVSGFGIMGGVGLSLFLN